MVPFHLARKWHGPFDHPLKVTDAEIAASGRTLVRLSKQILHDHRITLPVRFRADVWATYFKLNSHLQFGGRCIRYQYLKGKGYDAVSSNIKRFGLDFSLPTKLAVLVCHECAHAVVAQKYGRGKPAHGREFYRELTYLFQENLKKLKNEVQA